MGERKFIGRREGDSFIVVGTVHQQSKKSFSYRAFKRAVAMAYPIDEKEFNHKKAYAGSVTDFYGNKAEGKTTSFGAAQKAVTTFCKIPKPDASRSMARDREFREVFNDNRHVYKHEVRAERDVDPMGVGMAAAMLSLGLASALTRKPSRLTDAEWEKYDEA